MFFMLPRRALGSFHSMLRAIRFAFAIADLSCRCAYLCVCFRFFLRICISLLRLRQSRAKQKTAIDAVCSIYYFYFCCFCCCCCCIQSSMTFTHFTWRISTAAAAGDAAADAFCCKHFDTPQRRSNVRVSLPLGHNWNPHLGATQLLIGKSNAWQCVQSLLIY